MPPPGFGSRLRLAAKTITGLFTERSATEAYGLLQGLYPSSAGPLAQRGTRELLEGYSKMPWLRAVSSKIGETVAATEWQLLAPTSAPAERAVRVAKMLRDPKTRANRFQGLIASGEAKIITEHPLLDALHKANEMLVGQSLMHLTQVYLDLVGEAFWIKERNALGVVVGFWPIPPNWIMMTPTVSNRVYRAQWAAWHGDIPDTEVVWFKHADPANPYGRGTGIARTLADELETDEYAARHTRMTLLNQARPDLIIWPEETKHDSGAISIETAARLAEKWRAEHQGFWRAALPYFATRKLGIQELGQDFKDLQLVELRKNERDIILQTYGMPPEEMGVTESSNRATATVSEFIYKKNLIVPRLEFLRANIQERLVPEYDERFVFAYVSPVQEDKEVQAEMAKAFPSSLMIDDWRQLQGFEPLPDDKGKVLLVSTQVTPVSDPTMPPIPLAISAPAATTPPTQRAKAIDADDVAPIRAALSACKDADDVAVGQAILRFAMDVSTDLPPLVARAAGQEPGFARAMRDRLTALASTGSDADLEHACKDRTESGFVGGVSRVLNVVAWRVISADTLAPLLRSAYLGGAREGASQADLRIGSASASGRPRVAKGSTVGEVPWNVVNPLAQSWAEEAGAELVGGVTDGVKETLRQILGDALEQGWSAAVTARQVRQVIGLTSGQATAVSNFAAKLIGQGVAADSVQRRSDAYAAAQLRYRSQTIARTELMTASNVGQRGLWNAAKANGLLDSESFERKWILTDDDRLCDDCEPYDDVTVSFDDEFDDGDPPLHPNCRCTEGIIG